MEDDIIKKIDYKVEEESDKEKGFDETYQNHSAIQEIYSGKLKPITIIITDRIVTCIQVWNDLVNYISEKENLSYDHAAKKVIWVTSGLPSSANEKAVVDGILSNGEKVRKENLALLKSVDEKENPVEWIVSVSMLTEGWDVKNVFQIVPHEQRAFNSKLLISQVLGRGLRIPQELEHPIFVKINNHEKWTSNIVNLYNEVLEIENKISWFYDESKKQYAFPLYNLKYASLQNTIESKKKPAKEPEKVDFSPQSKRWVETSIYSETGSFRFTVENKDILTIEQGARQIKLFLKEKDDSISKQWSIKKIKDFVIKNLEKDGYDSSFLTNENLSKTKKAFGPMFRELDKEVPRMKMQPDSLYPLSWEKMSPQSCSEDSIKENSYVYYTKDSVNSLSAEQKTLFGKFLKGKANYNQIKENLVEYGGSEDEIKFLQENLFEKTDNEFKTPLNMLFVSYEPERRFTNSLFNNIDLFDSIFKSPDKGFYCFPYSYKPDEKGSTHVKRDNFNPDFFIKLKDKNEILVVEIKADEILVVEIKAEGDTKQRNKAKYRDGKLHFDSLNKKLKENSIDWKYHFYFLSPEDRAEFFQAVRDGRYKNWKSGLMQGLSGNSK
jgi:type III restriction enzyme